MICSRLCISSYCYFPFHYFIASYTNLLPLKMGCFLLLEKYMSHCVETSSTIDNYFSGLNAEWISGYFQILGLFITFNYLHYFSPLSRNSDGLRAGRPGFNSRQYKIFLFSTASRSAVGPTQPPIQCIPGALSLGSKPDQSTPSSTEVKDGGAISPLPHKSSWHSAWLIKHRDKFTFTSPLH
jgi:hypothetical protein